MFEAESSRGLRDRDYLVIRDEMEFCSHIEARLKEGGFELLETSPIVGWGVCMSAGLA
jgi:hypothetical protein